MSDSLDAAVSLADEAVGHLRGHPRCWRFSTAVSKGWTLADAMRQTRSTASCPRVRVAVPTGCGLTSLPTAARRGSPATADPGRPRAGARRPRGGDGGRRAAGATGGAHRRDLRCTPIRPSSSPSGATCTARARASASRVGPGSRRPTTPRRVISSCSRGRRSPRCSRTSTPGHADPGAAPRQHRGGADVAARGDDDPPPPVGFVRRDDRGAADVPAEFPVGRHDGADGAVQQPLVTSTLNRVRSRRTTLSNGTPISLCNSTTREASRGPSYTPAAPRASEVWRWWRRFQRAKHIEKPERESRIRPDARQVVDLLAGRRRRGGAADPRRRRLLPAGVGAGGRDRVGAGAGARLP